MKNIKFAILVLVFSGLFVSAKPALAKTVDGSAQVRTEVLDGKEVVDSRYLLLTSYLRSKKSP
ncbi:hypothetical protein, partial [Methanoculleus sp.]|uniref:hypothetical protein n=1 Tax=Methanoculleus sp. TaxID=90427 RepID=UPI00261630F3